MMEYHFGNLPLDKMANRSTMAIKNLYAESLERTKDVTELLKQKFQVIGLNPMNIIMSVEGAQGSGKSYAVISLAEYLSIHTNIPLDIDNVCFSITDMLSRIKDVKKRAILILDEQVLAFGMGSGAEKEGLANIERVVRKFKLNLFFLAPDYIPHVYHYHLETWEPGSDKKFDFTKPLKGQWKFEQLIIFNRRKYPFGHIWTATPRDTQFLAEYEEKKELFINNLLLGKVGNRPKQIQKVADDFIADSDFIDAFRKKRRVSTKRHLVSMNMGIEYTKEERDLVSDIIEDSI
jgi:hypothetical protein